MPPKYPQEAKELHNKLMTDLYDYVNPDADKHDYNKFKNRLKTVLSPLHIKVSEHFADVVDQLEKKGKVKPGQYEVLKEIFFDIDQRWVDKLEETEDEIQEMVNSSQAATVSSSSVGMHC